MCVSQACIYSAEVPLTSQVSKVTAGQGFCPQQHELTALGSSSIVLPAAVLKQERKQCRTGSIKEVTVVVSSFIDWVSMRFCLEKELHSLKKKSFQICF